MSLAFREDGVDFDALTFAAGVVLALVVVGLSGFALSLAQSSGKVSKSTVRAAQGVSGLALFLGAAALAYLIYHASAHSFSA